MSRREFPLLSLLDENEFRRAGGRCRQVRERLGISPKRFAARVGLEVSELQAFEEGISYGVLPTGAVVRILLALLDENEERLSQG